MAHAITMPALSPTMEEGKIVKWHVKPGDPIKSGDILAEIETDKAVMDLESIEDGIIADLMVKAGADPIKVNQIIAYIKSEGEEFTAPQEQAPASAVLASAVAASAVPATAASAADAPGAAGPAAAVSAAAVPASAVPAAAAPAPLYGKNRTTRFFASPRARHLARKHKIDLAHIKGSGPKGRIIERDIIAYIARQEQPINKAAPSSQQPANGFAQAAKDNPILQYYNEAQYELRPHSTMRKTIAQRLTQAKQSIPHFYLSIDCAIDKLQEFAKECNNIIIDNNAKEMLASGEDQQKIAKITLNDFFIKAIAYALQKVPQANVSWFEHAMLWHKNVDISIAVALEDGLITPILKQADKKSLREIARETKELIAKARNKQLAPHEYQGGTTSISNMGMFGVREFSAIVNPPQATIFAIGAACSVPVACDGNIKFEKRATITISVDHRAIDGAIAARLGQSLKRAIENPLTLLLA